MNRHLTEQELIEFQFKLASDDQRAEISGHLKECSQCSENLEQMQRKFSSLELLREEVKASDDLISSVIKQASHPVRTRIISFRKPAWLSAAAAVLLVGSLLLFSNLYKDEDRVAGPEIVKEPVEKDSYVEGEVLKEKEVGSESLSVVGKLDERVRVPLRSDLDIKDAATKTYAPATLKHKSSIEKDFQDTPDRLAVGEDRKAQISEQPPFAPASAIELVLLPRRDKAQLTIYNSADLTLVRERRNLTLKRGWNWLQFMWANTLIDPTSLSLEPLAQADKVDIQQLVFPPRLRELGRWLIRSEVSGQVPFEITYFTSRLNWRAFYMGTLTEDEKKMRLQGYVRVTNNSGEDYENAQTRLIVGKVHILDEIAELARQQYPYGKPGEVTTVSGSVDRELERRDVRLAFDVFAEGEMPALKHKEIKKEGLSEYFLYTIEGTETIPTGWSKRLMSFDVDEVPVVNLYKYEQERYGNSVVRFLSFKNDEEHKLGETPIPGGMLKVYRDVGDKGHLSYTGQSSFKYIPVDEDVELNLGAVGDVVVEPTLMDFETKNYRFDRKRNISGWDEVRKFKIEVKNTRDIGVKVEVQRNFPTQYWKLQKNGDIDQFEKVDLDTVKFTLALEPRSAKKIEYALTTYHGIREDASAN